MAYIEIGIVETYVPEQSVLMSLGLTHTGFSKHNENDQDEFFNRTLKIAAVSRVTCSNDEIAKACITNVV